MLRRSARPAALGRSLIFIASKLAVNISNKSSSRALVRVRVRVRVG